MSLKPFKNVFFEINKSKLISPLIVIDPIQKERNAAAALDYEKFEILKHRAIEFLKKPSKDFFNVKFLTEQDLKKKFHKKSLILLKCKPLNKKIDVAGAKILAPDVLRIQLDEGRYIIGEGRLYVQARALFDEGEGVAVAIGIDRGE